MRASWTRWLAAGALAACGGKTVVDGHKGSGGAGGTAAVATTGITNATSGSVGSATTTPVNCADIATQYRASVKAALGCNPALNVEQCTKHLLRADLDMCCGPDTWVNAMDTKDVNTINQLTASYSAAGCDVKCQAVDCPPLTPTAGTCDAMTKACRVIQLK